MYQFVSAVAKLRAVGSRWVEVDLSSLAMSTIYETYKTVYAVLSNPFYSTQRCLNLEDIRQKYQGSSLTFVQMLAEYEDNALPTTANLPNIKTKFGIYSDLFQARYKIEPISPDAHPSSGLPLSDRNWLSLTRADTDYALFFKSCLIAINGLFHLTDADSSRVYVVDGAKSARYSGKATAAAVSFREVGDLSFLPITASMIYRGHPDVPMSDRMYVKTGVVHSDKTAMLVLGGYLHVLDQESFYRFNDDTFIINFKNIPLKDRYFDSRDLIDLSSLNLSNAPGNADEIDKDELYSDTSLTAYATLSQSFLVFVDNPEMFVETLSIQQSHSLQGCISYIAPHWPMTSETGKLINYWRVHEDGQWSCTFEDGYRNNYNFNDTPLANLQGIDNHRIPYDPVTYPNLKFLRIGSDFVYWTPAQG